MKPSVTCCLCTVTPDAGPANGRPAQTQSSDAVRLSAEELGLLAAQLASASDPAEAIRLTERLTRGYYGI